MRKLAWFTSFICLILFAISLTLTMPASVMAIGEVTSTPVSEEDDDNSPMTEEEILALIDEAIEDIQAGEFRSALAKMDIVIEFDATIPTTYYIRGLASAQLGSIDDALDDFSTAIELAPWRFDFYILRGDIHFINGSTGEALLDYDESISINPFSPDGFSRRSEVFFELGEDIESDVNDLISRALESYSNGDTSDAFSFLDEAIELGEDLKDIGDAYYLRAIIGLDAGDLDAVLEDYSSALEVNPDLHHVYLARGILYAEQGNVKVAGRDFLNRMMLLGSDFIEEEMAIGESKEFEMTYQRVYEISFEGTAGQVITISANDDVDTVVDPLITLLNADGEAIAGDDDLGGGLNSEITEFQLPDDGTYTLLLSHAGGGSGSGYNGIVEVSIDEE